MKQLAMFLLFLLFSPFLIADAYKWTDADGNVHYGDRPPSDQSADEIAVGEKKQAEAPPPDAAGTETPVPETTSQEAVAQGENSVAESGDSEECRMLRGKLDKFNQGLIDFSYETESGRKITPPKAKIIKAYEEEIAKACGDGEITEEAEIVAEVDEEEETE